jgi:hypothetical protein
MSLYRRQSIRYSVATYTRGKDDAGDWSEGLVFCGRITIMISTDTPDKLERFHRDCDLMHIRRTFVHGLGATRSKPDQFYRMAFSVSGPVEFLDALVLKDYYVSHHGRGRFGAAIEEEGLPRNMAPMMVLPNGEANPKRLPPVPTEARRVVRPDLPNVAEPSKVPVYADGSRNYSHPLPKAADYTKPMVACGRVVCKPGKMTSQVKAGREATKAEVAQAELQLRLAKSRKWAKLRKRKAAKLAAGQN